MFEWVGGSWHKTIIDGGLGRWSGKTNTDGSVVALDGRSFASNGTPGVYDRNSEGGYDKRPNLETLGEGNNGYWIALSADGNRIITAKHEGYGPIYHATYDPASQTWHNTPLEGSSSTVWFDQLAHSESLSYAIAKTSSGSPDPGNSTVWKYNESSNIFEIDSYIDTSAKDLVPYYTRHAISEDGNTAALAKWAAHKNYSRYTNIYKKNGSTWTTLTTIPSEEIGSPFGVSLSADGKAVAIADYDPGSGGGGPSIRAYKINENGSYVKILDVKKGRLSYAVCLR